MLDQTANPPPPSAPPTLQMFRSPPCLLHSPILSLPCSLPSCLSSHRTPALSNSSPICHRRASVRTPRLMSRWMFTGSHTATACRRPTRSPQKTSIRRMSSSSKLQSAALRSAAVCKKKKKRWDGCWLSLHAIMWRRWFCWACVVSEGLIR